MRDTEEDAIILIEPYLEQRCRGRWCALELEDRLAEAQLVFLATWRTRSTNTGHFLQDLDTALDLHMKDVLRKQGLRTYSLDTPLGETGCNGYTLYAASFFDESKQHVRAFLDSLPQKDHNIIRARLDGFSKTEIARETGLSIYQLDKRLKAIGTKYLNEYGEYAG